MAARLQHKRGLAATWATKNLVLSSGELGIAIDTGVIKIGDGTTPWNSLPIALDSAYLSTTDKAADSDKLDGYDHTAFLKVVDAATTYLAIGAKAADSNLLDGLDSSVFQQISDTGDLFPTLGTGFVQGSVGDRPTYRRRNGWVQARGWVVRDTGTRIGTVFTLPVGYRPSYAIWGVFTSSGGAVGGLKINTDGTVVWETSVTTGLNGVFNIVFPIASTA